MGIERYKKECKRNVFLPMENNRKQLFFDNWRQKNIMNDTHTYLLCLPVMMALNPKNHVS